MTLYGNYKESYSIDQEIDEDNSSNNSNNSNNSNSSDDFILTPKSQNTFHYNLLLTLNNEFTITNTIRRYDYDIYKKYEIYNENDDVDTIDFHVLIQVTINHDKFHDIDLYWYDKMTNKEIHHTFCFHFIDSIYSEIHHDIGESKLILSFDTKTIQICHCPSEINNWFQHSFFNLFNTSSKRIS